MPPNSPTNPGESQGIEGVHGIPIEESKAGHPDRMEPAFPPCIHTGNNTHDAYPGQAPDFLPKGYSLTHRLEFDL